MSHQHVLPWQPISPTTNLITAVSLFYIFDITVSVHNTQLRRNVNSPNFRYIGAGTLPTFPCGNIKFNCYKRRRVRPIFLLECFQMMCRDYTMRYTTKTLQFHYLLTVLRPVIWLRLKYGINAAIVCRSSQSQRCIHGFC